MTMKKVLEREEVKPFLTFADLAEACRKRQLEWDPEGKLSLPFFALELAGEAGEAANLAKKLWREEVGIRGSRATKQDFASELADVVISAMNNAEKANINLANVIVDKFNETSFKIGLQTFLAPTRELIE